MNQPADGRFPSTHWTLIATLKGGDDELARRALNELCTQYHYPIYCYIRRRGLEHHDAQDALHDFLAKILQANSFAAAEAHKGRLRGFLSAALRNFLVNWHRDHRHRRDEVSVEQEAALAEAEDCYLKEHFTDEDTPDRVFDRKWAHALLQQVLRGLDEDYAARGRGAPFKVLKPVLIRGGSLRGEDPAALAQKLGITEGALRTALNRLLRHFRDHLKNEVRQTVAGSAELADELAHLHQSLGVN